MIPEAVEGVTVAVSFTGCPNTEGFAELLRVTLLAFKILGATNRNEATLLLSNFTLFLGG
jgi:hypothetical protein